MTNADALVYRSNFLLLQEYSDYLLNVKSKNPKSVDRYGFWLRHLLLWAMDRPFETADTIKPPFVQAVNALKLAAESKKKIVETARSFFKWAKLYHEQQFAGLPAYWIEDLTPPKMPHGRSLESVTCEDVLKIVRLKIDRRNLALFRDQAMAALLFLSGARVGAATTLPIQAVHLNAEYPNIEQKPSLGVHTKNGQSATTFLHNIPELLEVAREWDEHVRKNCPPEYPWYAPVEQSWGDQKLSSLQPGENRGASLNRRLKILEEAAGLPHRSPHKYRHGYALYGLQRCQNMAQYVALSRNLMHANIAITDEIYVHVEEAERGRLLGEISQIQTQPPDDVMQALLAKFGRQDIGQAFKMAADLLLAKE
jgi:site-specific recombinase XerD